METSIQQPYPFNERGSMDNIINSSVYEKFNRLAVGDKLSREERNNLFHTLLSNSGRSEYMLGGMIIPFTQFMKRYFVKYSYGDIREIWAFDKTCIRYSFYTNGCIAEIIEVPTKD